MAAGDLRHARSQGVTDIGHVVHGDARNIAAAGAEQAGTADARSDLASLSATTHGRARASRDNGGGE